MRVKVTMNQKALEKLSQEQARSSTRTLAEVAARRTRDNIVSEGRVRTGRMLRSVDVRAVENGYAVGSDVEYFEYQERGTSRGITAGNFMRRAVDSLTERDIR